MFGALSHQSSELELNQQDHMLTQAASTVKICAEALLSPALKMASLKHLFDL